MRIAVRLQFKVTSTGKWNFSYIRPEYAENVIEQAELFDNMEDAENAADVAIENMSSYTHTIKATFISVQF